MIAQTTSRRTSTVRTPIQLTNRRAVAAGIRYDSNDGYTTTVIGNRSTCNCGLEDYHIECGHRRAAEAQEAAYAAEAARRATYCEEFSIY